jgi:predicted nucleic-acid-binding Zn-ribbon protein
MQNGLCPKCSSGEVYYSDATGSEHGLHDAPLVNLYKDRKWVPDISMLELAYYLCQSCGYLDMYVRDTDQLSKLGECTNWRKVERSIST